MTKKKLLLPIGLATIGLVGSAEATLLGVTPNYQAPYIDLENAYIIYDNDGVNASTGLMTVVSFGSRLYSSSTGSNQGQSYWDAAYGGSDWTPDTMLTFAINTSNGSWNPTTAAGANQVTVSYGDPIGGANTPVFSWSGNITNFGWLEDQSYTPDVYEFGTKFDATWEMTGDSYVNMPSNMSQFIDSYLTNLMSGSEGSIIIDNWSGFVDPDNAVTTGKNKNTGWVPNPKAWQRDWVFGASVYPGSNQHDAVMAALAPYLTGLSTTECTKFDKTNCLSLVSSSVFASVFVPIPPALLLWGGALATLLPSLRRFKRNTVANDFAQTA